MVPEAKTPNKPSTAAGGYHGGGKSRSQSSGPAGRSTIGKPQSPAKKITCPYCTSAHTLFDCGVWKSLKVMDRVKFCTNRHICVNCLSESHRTAQCPSQAVCPVDKCGLKHVKLLHIPFDQWMTSANASATQLKSVYIADSPGTKESSNHEVTNATGVGDDSTTRVGLPIVPIKVRADDGKYTTSYAMLDSGSSQTFCTNKLAEQLALTGEDIMMLLTTLEGKGVPVTTK